MAIGWMRLPGSGQPYYGTLRPGTEEISAPEVASTIVDQPPKDALKPVWAKHAATLGIDVDGLTKRQIIGKVEELVQAGENDPTIGGEVAGIDLPADPGEARSGSRARGRRYGMTVAYASAAELEAFVSPAVWESIDATDVDRLLARATEIIDDHCRAGFVVDTTTNLPADTDVADALRDATCAQIEFWAEVGEEHDVSGLASRQASIGHLSMDRLPPELAPRARRFMAGQGLLQPTDHAVWPQSTVVVP